MNEKHHTQRIFLLLALLLIISLSLAWQAVVSVKSHQKTVDAVLQDYSELIVDDFIRSLRIRAGYEGLYQITNLLSNKGLLQEDLSSWSADQLQEVMNYPALPRDWLAGVFRINTGASAGADWLFGTEDQLLAAEIANTDSPGNGPFQATHIQQGQVYGLQLLVKDERARTVVLIMRPASLREIFENVFQNTALLPPALGTADELRPHIQLQVSDPDGNNIYQSRSDIAYPTTSIKTMDDSYSGLFAGFGVVINVAPAIADALAIGSPPWNNMIRVGLLLLTSIALGIAAVVLIRRDRQLMALRSDFIARVSHELRTPLTQIRMFTESILLKRLPDRDGEERALKIIDRETLRLSRLVENILSFSRNSEQPVFPEPEPYLLEPFLVRLRDEFELQLQAAETTLEVLCDPDLTVSCNRDALSQLLTNLLDNALKYGPAGQLIVLRANEQADALAISVQDHGPGIPEAEQAKIWQPYFRLGRERGRGIAGTGIGLAVANELATSMDATIGLSSSDDGSIFTVNFTGTGSERG